MVSGTDGFVASEGEGLLVSEYRQSFKKLTCTDSHTHTYTHKNISKFKRNLVQTPKRWNVPQIWQTDRILFWAHSLQKLFLGHPRTKRWNSPKLRWHYKIWSWRASKNAFFGEANRCKVLSFTSESRIVSKKSFSFPLGNRFWPMPSLNPCFCRASGDLIRRIFKIPSWTKKIHAWPIFFQTNKCKIVHGSYMSENCLKILFHGSYMHIIPQHACPCRRYMHEILGN